MHNSDQPSDEQKHIDSSESTQNQPQTQADVSHHENDSIQQGLVYPPPPSFYQRPEQTTQSPQKQGVDTPQQGYVQPQSSDTPEAPKITPTNTTSQHPQYPPPMSPPAGAYPQYPPAYPPYGSPYFPAQPPAKKSRKWLWITLSILGAILLITCGLCTWAVSSTFGQTFTSVTGGIQQVNDYYDALQNKQYAQAYTYLQPSDSIANLTQEQFKQRAEEQDTQYGPVLSYTMEQPNFTIQGDQIKGFTVEVKVKREKNTYTAVLTLERFGNNWKITEFDKI